MHGQFDVLERLPSHPAERLGELPPDAWARAQRGAIDVAAPTEASQRAAHLAAAYTERAMARLGEAIAHGYKDVGHLQKDTDLDPLRQRDDFKKPHAGLINKK